MIKNICIYTVLSALLLVTCAWGALKWMEWRQLYRPSPAVDRTPTAANIRYQEIQWMSDGGIHISGWWIPARHPRGTILYCHGNSGNMGDNLDMVPFFLQRNWNVLLWDYRGYGHSRGFPTETGIYADARGAFDAARQVGERLPIVAYGHSLGAAVAIQLTLDRPVSGLIAEGAFSSIPDLAKRRYPHLPLWKAVGSTYDSIGKAPRVPSIPKLFAHSEEDVIVPYTSGLQLFTALSTPKQFVRLKGTHASNLWSDSPASISALDDFLKTVLQFTEKPAEQTAQFE